MYNHNTINLTYNASSQSAQKDYTNLLTIGKKYRVSFDFVIDGTTTASFTLSNGSKQVRSKTTTITTKEITEFTATATNLTLLATLSAGNYGRLAHIDNLVIEEIFEVGDGYRFGFNGMEKDNEVKGEGNSYDFGARIYDSRLGRWLSLDPSQEKYPSMSPYNFVSNNPLILIDIDGRDNIIYLVVLPDAKPHLGKVTPQQIADQVNKNFSDMGLKTEVRVIKPEEMSYTAAYRDATDGIAVIGGSKKSVDIFTKPYTSRYQNWGDQKHLNPERSTPVGINDGKFIGIDASELDEWSNEHENLSFTESTALLINHGAGHNSGNPANHTRGGNANRDFGVSDKNNEIVKPENNKDYIEDMKSKQGYGDNAPKDNRMKNFIKDPHKIEKNHNPNPEN